MRLGVRHLFAVVDTAVFAYDADHALVERFDSVIAYLGFFMVKPYSGMVRKEYIRTAGHKRVASQKKFRFGIYARRSDRYDPDALFGGRFYGSEQIFVDALYLGLGVRRRVEHDEADLYRAVTPLMTRYGVFERRVDGFGSVSAAGGVFVFKLSEAVFSKARGLSALRAAGMTSANVKLRVLSLSITRMA